MTNEKLPQVMSLESAMIRAENYKFEKKKITSGVVELEEQAGSLLLICD